MFSSYADESGSADIHNHSQPWFVLLAIGFNDDDWLRIDEGVTTLKKAYFPSWNLTDVEIPSNDIRRAPLQAFPPNPFSTLSACKLAQFGQDLYDLIDSLPFEWCACIGQASHHRQAWAHDFRRTLQVRIYASCRASNCKALPYELCAAAIPCWARGAMATSLLATVD